MPFSVTVYLFCVALSIANLVMATVLLLAMRKARSRTANLTLSLLLLCLAGSFFLGDIYYRTPLVTRYPHWAEGDSFLTLCLGPLLYFYILYQTRPDFRWRPWHLLHLLPLLLHFGILWEFYTSPAATKLAYLTPEKWSTIPTLPSGFTSPGCSCWGTAWPATACSGGTAGSFESWFPP